jgi:hypothetical protein
MYIKPDSAIATTVDWSSYSVSHPDQIDIEVIESLKNTHSVHGLVFGSSLLLAYPYSPAQQATFTSPAS